MDEISLWLERIGLGQYAPVFVSENIDLHILPTLTESDLKELGLSLGHRRMFLKSIQKLTTQSDPRAAPPALPPNEGQRRQLTLLFCDIVDSTRLAARLDPEDLREVIGAYRLACMLPIKRYDGFIARFAGDGLLAYFGYPQAHEDDAERGIHAGLGIIEAMKGVNAGFGTKTPVELSVRIGIATGPVVVGDILGGDTREQDAVTGEAPNLAARLQGLANPNAVVVSAETRQLVGDRFEFLDLGENALKGIDKPVQAWQVTVEKSASRFSARGSQLSPLVGRGSEIDIIRGRWQAALSGKGQVVLLRGAAGIGKSRIAATIREYVEGSSGALHPQVLQFQGSPFHSNTSLYPILRELGRLVSAAGDDDHEDRLGKIRQVVDCPEEEVSLFAELIAARSGLPVPTPPMGSTEKRQRTLDALVRWFNSLASKAPLLAVVEDIQWLDPTSQQLLQRLISWAAGARALIIMTLRTNPTEERSSDEIEAAGRLWAAGPHVTVRDLQELGERDATRLLLAVAGGRSPPAPVVETLLRKAEGNPLYIEELTKGWVDSFPERSVEEGGPASNRSTVGIPATLMDALMARLDQAGAAQEVAQHAAVIGHDFSLNFLASVSTLPMQRLEDGLRTLTSSDIIMRTGSDPDYSYRFKHALLQDAAYRSLLKTQRKPIHFKIAQKLDQEERGTGGEMDEVIAQHYALGGAPREAIACWRQAAEHAFNRSAHAEAANLLNLAIEVLEGVNDPVDRKRLELDLTLELAAALRSLHGYAAPTAEAQYRKARELSEALGDLSRRFNIEWGLMQCNYVKGEMEETVRIAGGLFEHARRHPDRPLVDAHLADGMVNFQLGNFEAARDSFEQGLALSEPETDQPHFFTHGQNPGTFCASFLAYTLWFLGFPDRAKTMVESNLAIAQKRSKDPSHVYSFVNALTYAVRTHQNRGEAALTKSLAGDLLAISRRNHYEYYEALAIAHLGWANSIEQSLDVGIDQVRRGIAAIVRTGTVNTLPGFYSRLAELYVRARQPLEAFAALQAAKDKNCRSMLFWDAELERIRGEALLLTDAGDAARAVTTFRCSLELARRQKARSLELRTTTSYARLLRREGRAGEAGELLERCLASFSEGRDTVDQIEARGLVDDLKSCVS